jgi:hypothetical protein
MDAVIVAAGAKPKGQEPICLPAASLAEGDTPPAEGDPVSFTIDGTVEKTDGTTVWIKPLKVNGEDITDDSSGASSDAMDQNAMDDAASKADQENGL